MLLLLLNEVKEAFSFSLQAVHFEHGLREKESIDDSRFAEQFCKEQGKRDLKR